MFELIPTKAQWRNWSLPSKLTFYSLCLTAFFGLLTIVFYIWPSSPGASLSPKPRALAEGRIGESGRSKPGLEFGVPKPEVPAALPVRVTIRENSAAEILRNLQGIEPSYRFHEKVGELYLGRWTQEPGWRATVDELPSGLPGGSWHCSFKEVDSGTLIFVSTAQDVSTLRLGDSVMVSGRIDRVSLLNSVGLEHATISAKSKS